MGIGTAYGLNFHAPFASCQVKDTLCQKGQQCHRLQWARAESEYRFTISVHDIDPRQVARETSESNGSLTGYGGGTKRKAWLLEPESATPAPRERMPLAPLCD